ncbi:MAG: glycosyltransferase, partial [Candidatus Sumerlaeota bacterium]
MTMRVLHIITGLGVGGAETMLLKLLEAFDPQDYECVVISLTGDGPMRERIEGVGVPVHFVQAGSLLRLPFALYRLRKMIREAKPDVIQTWMYHADLFGGLAA